MEQTSFQNSQCEETGHIGKALEWKYELVDGQVNQSIALWGCTRCDATSPTVWEDFGVMTGNKNHTDSESCVCFKCKAQTIQMNAGDAKGAIISGGMTQKAWDKELDAYKAARRQGIQPKSTRMKDIKEAVDISNKVGKAYDASSPTGGII